MAAANGVPRFLIIVAIGGIALGACLAALIPGIRTIATAHHYTSDVDTSLDQLPEPSYIYQADGQILSRIGVQDRQPIASLDEVPDHVIDAVIAIEDQTFWTNDGFDPNAVFRAFWANLTAGKIEQGGSTITQQLAKNRILTDTRDLRRKIRELIVARRLNDEYSKEQILVEYLNTVYFGQGAYGIKSAAGKFFLHDVTNPLSGSKTLTELTIGDAALLAGVIQNPTQYNPWDYPEAAAGRREVVLDAMVDQDMITKDEATLAAAEPLPNPFFKPITDLRPRDYYSQEVLDRLLADPRLGETEQARRSRVLRGGLHVFTPWDPRLQSAAQGAVDSLQPSLPFRSSILAMDPRTGEVKAFVGGEDFFTSQYNIATLPPGRQPGSSWKMITLTEAIEQGYSSNDTISGASPCQVGDYLTRNAGDTIGGSTLRAVTVGSVNCAFVRLLSALGMEETIDMAYRLGITQEIDSSNVGLSMTLGTKEATPLEMATVASTLANDGIRHDPVFYTKVVGPDGEVLIDETTNPGERAVDSAVASCVVDITRGVFNGTASGSEPAAPHENAFGKTGTTDGRTDAWFVGATPQLAAAVWSGNPIFNEAGVGFGGDVSAPIWQAFMNEALAGLPGEDFVPPGPNCFAPGQPIREFAGRGDDAFPAPAPAPTPRPTPTASTLPPVTAPPTVPPTTPTTTNPPTTTTTTPPPGP
ncbi:MAG: transglycosylase domain-containing protein [Acidimicrobiia bacterium]